MPEARIAYQFYPHEIKENHGFPAERIRNLIKESLTPIPTDPIPSAIIIRDIKIKEISASNLEITCEVLYEL